ncbi:asparagine synthetase [glutamine-hydrolyzing]-like [Pecten maximus]|uniref:asparagine synthetase [glutamine-hydrolyzing]-like n=1 Tax=Pecten maximus TaxID=6579 RepID=UPI001458BE93|nr:asparagine synthetase [glutamine-hydrolyzing]-like [Pecten maximus]
MDVKHGMQPMRVSRYPHIWLIYNGEIYNHRKLQEEFKYENTTNCDGESIIHLYAHGGIEFAARHLDGVFAFCLLDTARRNIYLGRDTFGVKPLFRGFVDAKLTVCSEVKGLMDFVGEDSKVRIQHVLPGNVETYSIDTDSRVSFENAIRFHQIGDVPLYASIFTPKGGLDSSLITALLVNLAKERRMPYRIQTFSVGMKDSPDLVAARKVANHLGTEHHEITFTQEEAISVIENVIYCSESYDVITIRASIAMYLLCKYVKEKTDTAVILSGEGADEIAQGYIYFHKAPSVEEGLDESRRLCKDISMFDVQRVDRMSAAFGLEIRVPYLDHTFSSYYLSLDPGMQAPKNGLEKHLLRSVFDKTDLIPMEILWRHKEGFSDGLTATTKSLYEMIQDFIEEKVDDSELDQCIQQYPQNPPQSKEALYYRQIFDKFYPGQSHIIPYFWMPKWSTSSDPSARTLKHYK